MGFLNIDSGSPFGYNEKTNESEFASFRSISQKQNEVNQMATNAAAQMEAIGDEYDLRADELTKEMFADRAGVTLRAVEIWKRDGRIEAEKVRRRGPDGKVRKQLIFKLPDVEAFIAEHDAPTAVPKVEQAAAIATVSHTQEATANALAYVVQQMTQMNGTPQLGSGDPQPKFPTIAEASEFYGLGESELHRLVADGKLTAFRGKRGEIRLSRRQIEEL